jgi:protein-disulfide isomerase
MSLEKARTSPDLERSVMAYKYNTNLFTSLLESQRYVHTGVSNITAGNPEASVLITMVSNPFCRPCAKAHEAVEKLLGGYSDYIKVEYIFTGNPQSEEVIKHLCSLPETQKHAALHDWYKTLNYEQWVIKYPISHSQNTENQLLEHREWCNQAEITHTPTFFVNGKELVSPYTVQDLKYHVKELAERVEI